jgi:hypothetical protein
MDDEQFMKFNESKKKSSVIANTKIIDENGKSDDNKIIDDAIDKIYSEIKIKVDRDYRRLQYKLDRVVENKVKSLVSDSDHSDIIDFHINECKNKFKIKLDRLLNDARFYFAITNMSILFLIIVIICVLQ